LLGEPVTMSVTGSPQRASDAPADIDIISVDDIRRSGAYDIPGVLSHVTGLDILQFTDDDAEIGIHGYNQAYSPRILVLIDGRQVYADYYGYTPWSTLPVELAAIQQIEVVKGPNSALFGFNAVGGVINIITSSPLRDPVNTASVSLGTQGLAQLSAVGTFKLADQIGLRVQIGGRRDDDFSTPIPALVEGSPRGADSRASIDATLSMQATDDLQLDLDLSRSSVDQNDFPITYQVDAVSYDTDAVMGRATADSAIGLIQAQLYNNWITYTYPIQTSGVRPGADSNQVLVGQVQDIIKLGSDHTLRGTVEYRHDSVNTSPTTGGHLFYNAFAIGAMWEWKVAPSVTATNAVRVDYLALGRNGYLLPEAGLTNADWNRDITEPSFNSSVVWRANDLDTFRLIGSRGVELPNLEDLGGLQELTKEAGLPLTVIGIPTLSPTVVLSWQAEWDRRIPSLNARLHASLYNQATTDLISDVGTFSLSPHGILASPANIGASRATGLDLRIDGSFRGNWHWSLGYSPEIVTDHFSKPSPFGPLGVDFQHTTPAQSANARLGWSRDKWEIDGYLRYQSTAYGLTSRFLGGALTRIDGFVTMDGRVAYKLTDKATLSLSGQNLGQATQRQTSGPDVERRVIGSVGVDF